MMIRKIIKINEELCNGCGLCAQACHEGAIEMIDGKAKLVHEHYCDGLGDCLPACPANAITLKSGRRLLMMRQLSKLLRQRKPEKQKPKSRHLPADALEAWQKPFIAAG